MQSNTPPSPEANGSLPPNTVVLQLLPALGHGGVERGTIEIAKAIVTAGGRAVVMSAGGTNLSKLTRVGAEHFEMPVGSKNPLVIKRNQRKIADLIRSEKISIVHARSRAPAWSACAPARKARVPFLTTYHGAYSEGHFLKRAYNRVMVSGDRVIAISQFVSDLIQERYRTPSEAIRIVHRGADLNAFAPNKVGAARLAKLIGQWGIAEDTRVILLPGRLTSWKGQSVLIEAFASLQQLLDVTNIAVVLAGSDQGRDGYRSQLLQLVRKVGLSERQVIFAGHCEDMPAALLLADVVVSASTKPEAFGRTMAEAAAMGKPVIAANHGAAPEIVLPNKTGLLVPPSDPSALAEALHSILSIPAAERKVLSDMAIARVEENFSVEAMCRKTLDVYRELLV